VDGKKIVQPAGTLLIEACKSVGLEIPSFCYYPGLSLQGACRMCLVEIAKMPKLQTVCTTFISEGMVVTTESDIVKQARKAMLEFVLQNHPMAIVGPITSGLLGLAMFALARLSGWTLWTSPATPGIALLVWLGYINLTLGAFNMIPGFPLDGGRVLRAILWWAMNDAERATRASAFVGQVIAVLFITFGILRFFQGAGLGGLWIAFIGWFLLQAAGATLMQVQTGTLLRGLRVKDVMSTDSYTVDPELSVQEFVNEHLLRTGRRCFLVVQDGRLLGLITTNEVRTVEPRAWPFTPVRSVMRSADKVHFVSRDMPAMEALETMGREDVNQLPVMSDGRVEGIVSRAHVLQVLRSRAELKLPPSLPRAA
jgi:CBS domain-containing protein